MTLWFNGHTWTPLVFNLMERAAKGSKRDCKGAAKGLQKGGCNTLQYEMKSEILGSKILYLVAY